MRLSISIWLACVVLAASSCGESEPKADSRNASDATAHAPTVVIESTQESLSAALPERIEIEDPAQPIANLTLVEDSTEEVANRLLEFSNELRKRDYGAATEFLSAHFAGEVPRVKGDSSSAEIVDRAGFIASLRELTTTWMHIESVRWNVTAAEFQTPRDSWGRLRLHIHVTGQRGNRGPVSLTARGNARVVREDGEWVLERFDLESIEEMQRADPIFTDVSASTGVAHTGIPFGKPGNTSYAFNGAASADVDGDGRLDIFVPSDGFNFLYMARADGTFQQKARERGVAWPDAGTGAVFFDFDKDGDQDLMVAHVAWNKIDGDFAGEEIQLYVNDGTGHFKENGSALGLDHLRFISYSLTVFDYDGDGWLDVYVCGYGRVEAEHNNSWIAATNGAPNALLRNLEGKGFADVAPELGLAGTSWSYASAAADYDQDGDVDLYVANDFGQNCLFENQGDGKFTNVAAERGVDDIGNGKGVSWGDLNSDGLLDLYVSNTSSAAGERILARLGDTLDKERHALLTKFAAGSSIFLAKPGGGFERAPASVGGVRGGWAWSPTLFDFDLDGDLDIYCANGFVTGEQAFDAGSTYWRHVVASSSALAGSESSSGSAHDIYFEPEAVGNAAFRDAHDAELSNTGHSFSGNERNKLWLNNLEGGFADLSDISGADSPGDGRAVLATDFDDDGDLDLFVHSLQGARHALLRNNMDMGSSADFLKLRLKATTTNYEAIGATVIVEANGRKTAQVMSRGAGFASCQAAELVFGLGNAEAGRVSVRWPSGVLEDFGALKSKTRVQLVEGTGQGTPFAAVTCKLPDPPPPGFYLQVGSVFPITAALDEQGRETLIDAVRLAGGQRLLVNFWASDAQACINEIPDLQALHQGTDLRVIAICLDAALNRKAAHRLLMTRGARFPGYYLGSAQPADEGPSRIDELIDIDRLPIPSSLVLLPDGTVEQVITGPSSSE